MSKGLWKWRTESMSKFFNMKNRKNSKFDELFLKKTEAFVMI